MFQKTISNGHTMRENAIRLLRTFLNNKLAKAVILRKRQSGGIEWNILLKPMDEVILHLTAEEARTVFAAVCLYKGGRGVGTPKADRSGNLSVKIAKSIEEAQGIDFAVEKEVF